MFYRALSWVRLLLSDCRMSSNQKTLKFLVRQSLLILCLAAPLTVHATEPLRDPKQLWEPRTETVLQLRNARVILADYDLIRKDFPNDVGSLTDRQIDAWLVDKTAYMSIQQVAQQEVNSSIPVTGKAIKAYRPREYGRAHVFKAGSGLIDAKGSGSIDPHAGFERTGLATLAEVIREFLMEKLVSKAFKDIGKYETVPCYAVLDLGYTAKGSGSLGQDVPAGMVLRRAHIRHHESVIGQRQREDPVVLPKKLQLEIELALRKYGITSTIDLVPGQYHVTKFGDQLNIQGDSNGAVVDFAGFRIKEHFDRPIYYTYDARGNAAVSDADIAVALGDPRFIQPSPKLMIPFHLWGNTVRQDMEDNPFIWSEELALSLASGFAQPRDALIHYNNLLDPVDAKLKKANELKCQAIFSD